MCRFIGVSLGVLCLAAGCSRSPDPKVGAADGGGVDSLIVGAPIRYANLTVFPVSSRTPQMENRFITLDEGLKSGKVEIKEVDAGGARVNQLTCVNLSDKPLYLMPGEIIVGGQQDRTVGREYVIAPGDKPESIDVFCVEHGRWAGRSRAETEQIAAAATANSVFDSSATFHGITEGFASNERIMQKFSGSVGSLDKKSRLAVIDDNSQSEVWDKVQESNAKSGVQSGSDAFTTNYTSKDNLDRLEPYVNAMHDAIATNPQVVGVIVAINGKLDTLDTFESTPLFLQLWPKLLKSYALDAANSAPPAASAGKAESGTAAAPPAAESPVSVEDAKQFLADIASGKVAKTDTAAGVATTTRSTDRFVLQMSYSADRAPSAVNSPSPANDPFGGDTNAPAAARGGMTGGLGGAVHSSGFVK